MISRLFHAWERRLVSVTTDRVVRPFEWGLDWIAEDGQPPGTPPDAVLADWADRVMSDTERFFDVPPNAEYRLAEDALTFPSAYVSPHPQNNLVQARYFPARQPSTPDHARRAVLVLPHWNAQAEAHVGLCRVLARLGISALRLTLPYHDKRMPPRAPSRRLRRQRERRPDGSGLPPGGTRFAARHRLVGSGGLRSDRNSRDEPRIVPGTADNGARATDTSRCAQPHLAVFR